MKPNKDGEIKYCFLDDRPTKDDAIGSHRIIAKKIYQIIHSKLKRPFVIGLFGQWGVGKSSIIEMLQDEGKNSKDTKIIVVDAWRKHKDTFLRQFVKKLAFQLLDGKSAQEIENEINIKKINNEHHWKPTPAANRWFCGFIVSMAVLACILSLNWYLKVDKDFPAASMATVFLTVLIAVYFQYLLPKYSIKTDSSEQDVTLHDITHFRRLYFQKIISPAKYNTICIVIDNLDRVSTDDAIAIIRTIKTFIVDAADEWQTIDKIDFTSLDKVVFLLPCDNKALQRNVSSSDNPQDACEFLRKFFNVSLRIPSFNDRDCYRYACNLLDKTNLKLNADHKDKIAHIMQSLFGANPRQPKIFINNFLAKFIAAEAFEEEGKLPNGIVTEHPDWFAVYVALESHFSTLGVPDSIEKARDMILKDETQDEVKKFLQKVSTITEKITPGAWASFHYLKRPNDYLLIDGLTELEEAALSGEEHFPEKFRDMQKEHKDILTSLWNREGREPKIKILQSVLNAKKKFPEIDIAERIAGEMAILLRERINDLPSLPSETVYKEILRPRSDILNQILYDICTQDVSILKSEVFKEGGPRRFQIELSLAILNDDKPPEQISDRFTRTLDFLAKDSDELIIPAVNCGRYFSQTVMPKAINLFNIANEGLSPVKLVDYCIKSPDIQQQKDYLPQIVNNLNNNLNSDKYSVKELCGAAKMIKPHLIKHNISNVPISNTITFLINRYDRCSRSNNWQDCYDILITLYDYTDFGSFVQFSKVAKQQLINYGNNFLTNGSNNMRLVFLRKEQNIVKTYFAGLLPAIATAAKGFFDTILDNYPDSTSGVITSVFPQNSNWVLEWTTSKSDTHNSLLQKRTMAIQSSLFSISGQTKYPVELYKTLRLLTSPKTNKESFVSQREKHFTDLLDSQGAFESPAKLQFVLERTIAADYVPNEEQQKKIDDSINKQDTSILPDEVKTLIKSYNKLKKKKPT
jgi:hypothetical protein